MKPLSGRSFKSRRAAKALHQESFSLLVVAIVKENRIPRPFSQTHLQVDRTSSRERITKPPCLGAMYLRGQRMRITREVGRMAEGDQQADLARKLDLSSFAWGRRAWAQSLLSKFDARGLGPCSSCREEGSALSSPFDSPTGNTLTEILPLPSAACFQGPLPASERQNGRAKAGRRENRADSLRPTQVPADRIFPASNPPPLPTSCPFKSSSLSESTSLHLSGWTSEFGNPG